MIAAWIPIQLAAVGLLTVIALGCAEAEFKSEPKSAAPAHAAMDASRSMGLAMRGEEKASESSDAGAKPSAESTGIKRQIIYNASVDLVVEDFTDVPQQVTALAKRFDAFVAD